MLKVLEYSVEFPTTGRSFSNRVEFAPGLTAITGRNEAGKSLIFEMIGYCLFGKAALRGLASDYRSLSASLSLKIGGHEVFVERARKETLVVSGETAAVGADAINREIPRMLGFGLDVFNIACAAQQGNLGALTEMRPTARKAMIDQLIGLDALEEVEKKCRAEAKTHETVAQSLAVSVAEPVEPVRPGDYEQSDVLVQRIAEAEAVMRRRDQLLAVPEPVRPEPPVGLPFSDTVEELEEHEARRHEHLQVRARAEGLLASIPEMTVSEEDLAKAIAYSEYQDEVRRRGPKPDYTSEQLDHWHAVRVVQQSLRDEVTCPKCTYAFHPGLTEEEEKLAVEECPLSREEMNEQHRRLQNWAIPLDEVEPFEIPNLKREINAYGRQDERTEALAVLEGVDSLADRSGDLRIARDHQRDTAVFAERDRVYGEQLRAFEAAREELTGLEDRSDELGNLRERLSGARHFEGLLAVFERDQERYAELRSRVADARDLAGGYGGGANALRRVRTAVKGELAPSLGRAASSLIGMMTNGERRSVVVDEEFNITVDAQPLQTLSGSGKSVVNLALRLGLGQVLTSRVLPVFLGDELDADCDADRAGGIASTMQTLRSYLDQVIIITHKGDLEADNLIEL